MQKEIWKDVKGYEGIYQVSNLGIIKSLDRTINHSTAGILKKKEMYMSTSSNVGYSTVILSNNGNKKSLRTHRLVAIAFIPNPNNKPCVNHINGIKKDNKVSNLEWVTYSENTQHAFNLGLIDLNNRDISNYARGENNGSAKLTNIEVEEIRFKYKYNNLSSRKLAIHYNVSKTNILDIVNYKIWNN